MDGAKVWNASPSKKFSEEFENLAQRILEQKSEKFTLQNQKT